MIVELPAGSTNARAAADALPEIRSILAASGDLHLAKGADAVVSKPYAWRHLAEVADALLKK